MLVDIVIHVQHLLCPADDFMADIRLAWLLWRQGACAVCNGDHIAMFGGCGSPSDQWWADEVRGPGQTWSTPRAPLISKLLSVGGCFDKRQTTLSTESQPNCRSVSGAITIIVQEVGITNSLGGYLLISDGWSSLGINCLQWLIIIAKDTTLSLSCTPYYLARTRTR